MMGPSIVGGSGTAFTTIRDRILKHQTTGADYHLLSTSGSFANARQQVLDIFRSNFAANEAEAALITPDTLSLEIATCSGGSGGAYGATSCHGGFPGILKEIRCLLSDLPAGPLSYVVGAGAGPGQWGGVTQFGTAGASPNFNRYYCYSAGTIRGGNNNDEHNIFHEYMVSAGMDPSTVRRGILSTLSSVWTQVDVYRFDRFSANRGPGGGGSNSSFLGKGGHGSMDAPSGKRDGGDPVNTKKGADHVATDFHSYGGGGAANGAGVGGGNGGYPGGGGGAGNSGTSTTWGYGGNGSIKIRGTLREIVK